jgi:hypothetical protein
MNPTYGSILVVRTQEYAAHSNSGQRLRQACVAAHPAHAASAGVRRRRVVAMATADSAITYTKGRAGTE